MAFKYSCFISYPHDAGKSVDKFVGLLKEALKDNLAQYLDARITSDHDINTGAEYNKTIPQAICRIDSDEMTPGKESGCGGN